MYLIIEQIMNLRSKTNTKTLIDLFNKCNNKQDVEHHISQLYDNGNLKNIKDLVYHIQSLYHEKGESPWSDKLYDSIIDVMNEKYNIDLEEKEVGSEVKQNQTVKLPYYMGSMNKFKTPKLVSNWLDKYKGPYVISAKLDGISAMYMNNKLYTRGNGSQGRDISFLLPFLKIGTKNMNGIRGELIMKKKVFETKYSDKFSNPRNLVCGILNRQYKNDYVSVYKDIDFIVYDIYSNNENYVTKFKWLIENGYDCVSHECCVKTLPIKQCDNYLKQWKQKDYLYEIDGIIISNQDIHEHKKSGNPDFAFAYKNNDIGIDTNIGIVSKVIWNISKDNYLKPTIQLQTPILCETSKVEFVTGFNAKYIKDNQIKQGRKLKIGLSGNVIPHIFEVVKEDSDCIEEDALLFGDIDCSYVWSKNNVDLICMEKDNYKQLIKQNALFFKNMNLKCNLQEQTLINVYNDLGIYHLKDLLSLNMEQWIKVNKMGQKKASTIMSALYDALHWSNVIKKKDISYKEYFIDLCVALQCFERGFAKKKIVLHVDYLLNKKNILFKQFYMNKYIEDNKDKIIKDLRMSPFKQITEDSMNLFLNGFQCMNHKMEELYHLKHGHFKMVHMKTLMEKTSIEHKTKSSSLGALSLLSTLTNYQFVFSGFRHKELMKKIEQYGGKIMNDVNKDTNILIVKDENSKTSSTNKIQKAKQLNISIYTFNEVINHFKEFKDIHI